LAFVDCADLDPEVESALNVFAKEERFLLDARLGADPPWVYYGYTVNKFKYPDDPRLHIWSAGAWVRRIAGRRFLFVNDMNGQSLQIYRFNFAYDGEIAIPSGFFAKSHIDKDGWPPHQPPKGQWIWRDRNGNGAFDPGEFESVEGRDAPASQGWWVDSAGNVWQAAEAEGIRKFPLQGLDRMGNPKWDYATMVAFARPDELARIKRLRYDPETDTMYLGGTTDEHKNQHWKPMGPVMCCYDDWSKPTRALRWKMIAPYQTGSSGHHSCEPMGFDVAGDYVFVPYTGSSPNLGFSTGHVEVFAARSGRRVTSMEPSQEVGAIGLQDIRECLTAHELPDGEYVIFLEDDWKAKVLMYRWRPE
jgi:hypothetical protein